MRIFAIVIAAQPGSGGQIRITVQNEMSAVLFDIHAQPAIAVRALSDFLDDFAEEMK